MQVGGGVLQVVVAGGLVVDVFLEIVLLGFQ